MRKPIDFFPSLIVRRGIYKMIKETEESDFTMNIKSIYLLIAVLLCFQAVHAGTIDKFLSNIQSSDPKVRMAARLSAPEFGAAAIVPLGKLMSNENSDVRVAARAAIGLIVHHTGRPGGEEERGEVCAEMIKLLAPDQPIGVKREMVFEIASIAGDRSVPAVARLLKDSDPHVRETARLSLERIPGSAAVNALIDAMNGADSRSQQNYLYSLSKKGGNRAVKVLREYAGKQGDPEVRFNALEGLARLGLKNAVSLFKTAVKNPEGMNRERLFNIYLTLADNLKARVDPEKAQGIYRQVAAEAAHDYLIEHAMVGACPPGSTENIALLITSISSPHKRVRRRANRLMKHLQGTEVLAALKKAYETSSKDARPSILHAMAMRDQSSVKDLIMEASQSSDHALKITALSLQGKLDQPDLEPVFLKLAEKGTDSVRPIAVRGHISLADKNLEQGNKEKAFSMYLQTLELASATVDQNTHALKGIVKTGDSRALDVLFGHIKDSALSIEAARGIIEFSSALNASGEKEKAAGYLEKIIKEKFPQEIIKDCMRTLKEIGFDPQAEIKKNGFVVDWWLTTPIIDSDSTGFDTKYFPEVLIENDQDMGFDDVHTIGPRRVRWRRPGYLTSNGPINLMPLYRRTENVLIYAYKEIDSPEAEEVLFKMGSDDAIRCWLNKELLHSINKVRDLKVDEDSVKAKLRKGKNKLLLKVKQYIGGWGFSFRITDLSGKPVNTNSLIE